MRILWVFMIWITVATCGVVPWSQSKEEEAIHLFRSYCLNADKGVNGNVKWFCKKPKHSLPDQVFEHYKVITARPHTQKQIIFVQTPSRTYKHNVYVKGEAEFNQDTDIYVVPGQDRHDVDIQGEIGTKSGLEGKPHTFYLQNNPLDYEDNKYPHNHDHYPSYKPHQHDHYPSYKPQSHDHYPSYSHTSPSFEVVPSDLEREQKYDDSRSQEENFRYDYRPPQQSFPEYNQYRSSQFDRPTRLAGFVRSRRGQNNYIDDDFVTPHPDTVRKFSSGFRNF